MRGTADPRAGAATSGDPIAGQRAWHAAHAAHRVPEVVAAIRARTALVPRVAIVLGSGLGGVVERVLPNRGGAEFDTATLPHWPPSTVPGHIGQLRLGEWANTPVAVLAGRAHPYEGYGADRVTLPVRILAALGARTLVLTNAAGSTHAWLGPGSLMLVRDHLNLQRTRGLLLPEELAAAGDRGAFGARHVYDAELVAAFREAARARGIRLEEGVLAAGLGPAYETAAEVAWLRRHGADAACMSTAMEALVGAGLGLRVAAISCITNYATGVRAPGGAESEGEPLAHDDVLRVAAVARERLTDLLETVLPAFA